LSKLTAKKRKAFIEVLSKGGSVTKGAEAIRVSRQALYLTKSKNKEFSAEWDSAIESGTDLLEDEAIRRGRQGTLKPVYYQGKRCGLVREYSDTLLIFTLKARRPEKFRDSATPNGGGEGKLDELLAAIEASGGKA
jgi:hypothetical protein